MYLPSHRRALARSVDVELANREGDAENLMSALACPSSRSPLVPMITERSLRSRCSIFVRCCRPACWSDSICSGQSVIPHRVDARRQTCVICLKPSSSTTVHSTAPSPPAFFPRSLAALIAPTKAHNSLSLLFILLIPPGLRKSSSISSSATRSASSSGRMEEERTAGMRRCKCWTNLRSL